MESVKRCDSALAQIEPPVEYSFWVNVSMAYKAAGGDYETWAAWCKRGSNQVSDSEAVSKWKSFTLDGGITEALLYKTALEAGWQDPERGGGDRQTEKPLAQTVAQTSEPPRQQVQPSAAALEAVAAYIERCTADRAAAVEYMASRGIDRQTVERFNIGWDAARKAVVIPYPGARSPYYIRRNTDVEPGGKGRRYEYPAEHEAGAKQMFNTPALRGSQQNIYITEGQINAISIEQMGGAAVGVNDAELLLAELKQIGKTDKRFFIVPDNDKTGMEKAKKLLDKLNGVAQAFIYPIPGEYNDSNEYLLGDATGFREWVNGGGGSGAVLIDSWVKLWDTGRDSAISTGFSGMDEMLDGGLYPGLYTVGAISSLGKTTFVLQIADQIAAAGHDIVFIALEQSAAEITAKTLSRLTAQISQERYKEWYNGQTVRNITSREKRQIWQRMDSQRQTVAEAVERYKQTIGKNMFIVEGLGDISTDQIRQYIKSHIARRGKLPVLVIDYVQILAAYGERLTDKQNMDRNIVELKRISRDLNIPVLGISSFNRASYTGRVDLAAFKESGAVEYTSDVIIGLQPVGMKNGESDNVIAENKQTIENCKNATLRQIEAVILKNRNGRTGTVNFDYRTLFNLYEDRGKVDLSEFKVNGQPIGAGGGQHF